jgi:hypothetical protein
VHLASSEDLSFVVKSARRTDRLLESVKEEFALLP